MELLLLNPDSHKKRVRFVVMKVVAMQATPGGCFNLLLAGIATTSAGNSGSLENHKYL